MADSNNFPQGLQALMNARRGLNPGTPSAQEFRSRFGGKDRGNMGSNFPRPEIQRLPMQGMPSQSDLRSIFGGMGPVPAGMGDMSQIGAPSLTPEQIAMRMQVQGMPMPPGAGLNPALASMTPEQRMAFGLGSNPVQTLGQPPAVMPSMGAMGINANPLQTLGQSPAVKSLGQVAMGQPNPMPSTLVKPAPQMQSGLAGLGATNTIQGGYRGPQTTPTAMYAKGGEVGLRAAAQQLQDKGRNGDTILAHINPTEAGILKALGGSGTINPRTGLREYGWFKKVTGISTPGFIKDIDDKLVQPVAHAVKDVVESPIGQMAAAYFGGPAGAFLASGAAGKGGFDFKRGLMAGAMTWGAQNLASGLEGAADAGAAAEGASAASSASVPPVELGASGANATYGEIARTGLTTPPPPPPPPGVVDLVKAGDYTGALSQAGSNISNAASGAFNSVANAVTNPSSLISDNALANRDWSKVMEGGSKVLSGDKAALNAMPGLTRTALPIYGGYTGMAALDEMQKYKDEAERAAGEQEADRQRFRSRAFDIMSRNPWQFQAGGSVDDEPGIDGLAAGGSPMGYAAGGTPRFLSGGGDGMSDSIPASINGKQPARLADGEFVIPADVVSHIGNGSSKAGAKQLYSMMDRVRKARTGTKKQGKEINPMKYLPS